MALDNKIKGILSLISGVLIQLLIGNLFSFPNLIPYYKSFLYYKNGKNEIITERELYFIAPVGIFVHNTFPSMTGYLDKLLGIRILTIIGVLSLLSSQLIMYFYIDYYLLIISYFLFGFCGSLTYFQTLKNCWKYFPNKKGLISGIIFSSFGLSSFIFTSLADLIINKDSETEDKNGYYTEEISSKFLDYIKFYIICIIIMGTISSILCFPYKERANTIKIIEFENEDVEDINLTKESNDETNRNKFSEGLADEEKKGEIVVEKKDVDEDKLTLKQSLLSLEFYKCLTVAGCTLIFGFLLSNTYRSFGIKRIKEHELGIQILSKAFTLLNTFSRLGWGLIYDKFGFKIPYVLICINQLICGSLIYLSSQNVYTYIIVVCCGVLSYAGHIILFPNLIHNLFGVDNSVIILGICGIFAGISCIFGPILTLFIIENDDDYLKIYLIGAAPTIISLILTFSIKVKKELNKEEKVEKKEKEEKEDDKNEDENEKIVDRYSDIKEN